MPSRPNAPHPNSTPPGSAVLVDLNRDPNDFFPDEAAVEASIGRLVVTHTAGEKLTKAHVQNFIRLSIDLRASTVVLQLDELPLDQLKTLQHIAPAYTRLPFAVYVPCDRPEYPCGLFAVTFELDTQLDILKKLATAFGPLQVIAADPDAFQDAPHYLELIAPHAHSLHFLEADDAPEAVALKQRLERIQQGAPEPDDPDQLAEDLLVAYEEGAGKPPKAAKDDAYAFLDEDDPGSSDTDAEAEDDLLAYSDELPEDY